MKLMRQRPKNGFTLLELLIVIAVISILAAIAVPRFAESIRTSNEGGTKGTLTAVRSGLSIYYSDMEGQFPSNLDPLTTAGNKYFKAPGNLLSVYTQPHGRVNDNGSIEYVASFSGDTGDTGHWGYVNSGTEKGKIFVQCTHTDTKGSVWTSY